MVHCDSRHLARSLKLALFHARASLESASPSQCKPDIVLPKYRTVIFVHGCFWHGHDHCPNFRLPKSRRAWWKHKIEGNRARDLRSEDAIRSLGWHVVTIWECALRKKSDLAWLAKRLPHLLGAP